MAAKKSEPTEIKINTYGPDGKPAHGGGRTDPGVDSPAHGDGAEDVAEAGEFELSEDELRSLCELRICPDCDVMQRAEADRLRALADAENVKKRLQRESEEMRKYAGEAVLADLLPVIDNLDLALRHGSRNEACKDFVMGVDMTRKIFLDTLKGHGLVPVGVAGEEFDPNVHEAVGVAQNPEIGDNAVAQVAQRGYLLKGRLLRPAKVMVNKLS